MDVLRPLTRRDALRGVAVSAATLTFSHPSIAQALPRVVVIGGGFGGASCARALKLIDPKLAVTLIEVSPTGQQGARHGSP